MSTFDISSGVELPDPNTPDVHTAAEEEGESACHEREPEAAETCTTDGNTGPAEGGAPVPQVVRNCRDEQGDPAEEIDPAEDVRTTIADEIGDDRELARERRNAFDRYDDDLDEEDREYEERMARAAARRRGEEDDDEPTPFPLRSGSEHGEPLPEDALPPRLRRVAEALAIRFSSTYGIAAVLLLSILNLVLQPHADVEMWGQARPLSLFTLVIAGSGSRKTSIYNRLIAPLDAFIRRLWAESEARRKREKKRGGEQEDPPLLTYQDVTSASLAKYARTSLGYMGLFVDEAATFLGSFAMQRENFLAMIGLMSKLWDAAMVVVQRAGDGTRIIDRKRFSLMLASPRAPFNNLLGNPVARLQGFLSRALIIAPKIEEPEEATEETLRWANDILKGYDRFVNEVLERELPIAPGTTNDLQPPLLRMTPEAWALIRDFDNEIKAFRAGLPEDDPIHDLCNKHAELAGRIAATLALVEDIKTQEVGETSTRHAIIFARHCMRESIRVAGPAVLNPHADLAERIAHWMAKRGTECVPRTDLQKASLGRKITVAEFDPALKLLIDSGWVIEETTKRKCNGGRIKHTYRLTRKAIQAYLSPHASDRARAESR